MFGMIDILYFYYQVFLNCDTLFSYAMKKIVTVKLWKSFLSAVSTVKYKNKPKIHKPPNKLKQNLQKTSNQYPAKEKKL